MDKKNFVAREIKSEVKYLKISPSKLKLVAESVKDYLPQDALNKLSLMPQKGAGVLARAVRTAVANAINNYKIDIKNLRFGKIEVCQGPAYKRWRAVSRGMAHPFKKKTSHLKITLVEKEHNGS